jgi:hypothetical protein
MELPTVLHMVHNGMDNSSVYKYRVQTLMASTDKGAKDSLWNTGHQLHTNRANSPTRLHCKQCQVSHSHSSVSEIKHVMRIFTSTYFFLYWEPGQHYRYSDRLWAGWLRGRSLSPGRGNIFFPLHFIRTSSGAHPASYPMGTSSSFPRQKVAMLSSWPLTSN